MNRNIHIGLPIGTASILLIFLTLSLTSFAVLSLETSVADMNLTSKSADYTQNYYAAFHEAQGFLADMDSKLSSLYYESADYNDYMRKAGFGPVSDNFPIGEMQYLHVEISIIYPSVSDINNHKKSFVSSGEDTFRSSAFYKISSFRIITRDDLLNYKDAEVPVY